MLRPRLPGRPTGFRQLFLRVCLVAIGAVIAVATPASARNANDRLCFPSIAWFSGPNNVAIPPVIDGSTTTDPGWRSATRYIFDNQTNGTPQPNVTVQGIKDASNLYLSFEVHKNEAFNDSDVLVLAFDPTGNAADRRRLHIYPVTSGQGSVSNAPPREVDYWKDSSTWQGSPAALPAWLNPLNTQANLRVSTLVSATDWEMVIELKIPLTGTDAFPLPANGDFGMYLNAIRIIAGGTMVAEDAWPPEAPQIGVIITNTPDPSTWGNGSLAGSSCSGVSITNSDITANGGTTQLNFPPSTNTFSVVVHNNTLNASGTPVLAPRIQPKFSIANFGLPAANMWAQIPTGNNPPPPSDIAPNSSVTFQTSPWLISDPTQLANFQANPHQCVMVELTASPPSTAPACSVANPAPECLHASIINNAAVQNMNFQVLQQGQQWKAPVAHLYAPELGTNVARVVDLDVRAKTFALSQQEVSGVRRFATELPAAERPAMTTERAAMTTESSAMAAKPPTGATPPSTTIGRLPPRPLPILSHGLLLTVYGYLHTGRFLEIRGKRYEIAAGLGAFGYSVIYRGTRMPAWQYLMAGDAASQVQQVTPQALYRVTLPAKGAGSLNLSVAADAAAKLNAPAIKATAMDNAEVARMLAIAR